jgi:hypothetical protein
MKNIILILISLLLLTGCTNKYVEVIKESPYTERVWETYGKGRGMSLVLGFLEEGIKKQSLGF